MSDDCCNVPAPARTGIYFPDEIILYGVKLNRLENYSVFFAGTDYELRVQLFDTGPMTSAQYSMALAYGYAFEGSCYRFDKVRAFIITDIADEDPVGCGFDLEPRPTEPVFGGGGANPAPDARHAAPHRSPTLAPRPRRTVRPGANPVARAVGWHR